MRKPFKMKGYSYPGKSPIRLTDEERRANLLKAVPNKEAYYKLSPEDQKGFDEAAKKVGLPTKTSPAKQFFGGDPVENLLDPAGVFGGGGFGMIGQASGKMMSRDKGKIGLAEFNKRRKKIKWI